MADGKEDNMKRQRTMLKFSASEESVSLRTVSRGFRSPHRFVVLEKELQELEEKRYALASDIRSYAEMHLERADTEGEADILRIRFTWLCCTAQGELSGTEEILRFPWDGFREGIERSRSLNGSAMKMLSMKDGRLPKIEFRSRKHLKEVAEMPMLRKKLGKFLSCHFAWKGSRKIVVTDDFVPYSFYFQEERANEIGICGGIILHGQEDMKKARYETHT